MPSVLLTFVPAGTLCLEFSFSNYICGSLLLHSDFYLNDNLLEAFSDHPFKNSVPYSSDTINPLFYVSSGHLQLSDIIVSV